MVQHALRWFYMAEHGLVMCNIYIYIHVSIFIHNQSNYSIPPNVWDPKMNKSNNDTSTTPRTLRCHLTWLGHPQNHRFKWENGPLMLDVCTSKWGLSVAMFDCQRGKGVVNILDLFAWLHIQKSNQDIGWLNPQKNIPVELLTMITITITPLMNAKKTDYDNYYIINAVNG